MLKPSRHSKHTAETDQMMSIRTYSELITIPTFIERFEYLKLGGSVGNETFGFERYLNQSFYHSSEWKTIRREVIIRDLGNDLALEDYPIHSRIYIHHMNPIVPKDIVAHSDIIFDIESLICCSFNTHQAIHYGCTDLLPQDPIERKPFDTCPWRM